MLLSPAWTDSEALLGRDVWPSTAAGITDEANALNCISLISGPTQTWLPLRLPPRLSFAKTAPVAGQLARVQEHQNIVKTAPCAPALLSKLTFKSKMESSPPCFSLI